MTVVNCLRRVINKTTTFDNYSPKRKLIWVFDKQVKYVQDIIVSRKVDRLGMLRKEVIQVILSIGQSVYYHKAKNNLD